MDKIKYIFFLLSVLLLGCSFLEKKESPVNQLAKLLDLSENNKKEIKNCNGEFSEVTPAFMSWGYFTYTADDKFINELLAKKNFSTVNEFNESFKKVPVDYPFKENDLSFYTDYLNDKTIIKKYDLKNKIALEGSYFPYKHQILYDTVTSESIHLVSGLRE
ncbi:hypothetical protein [Flavobacterium sp. H122]|uniref:hypothetical protein n=1 Tax=Flavobacterium sp. H122 TaxID=2529860 RepID=UPI0010A9F84A|nr:hypothetical protein [Flavobacterium sp. H122]